MSVEATTDNDNKLVFTVRVDEDGVVGPGFTPRPVFPGTSGNRTSLYLFAPFGIGHDGDTDFYTGGYWLLDLSGAHDYRAGIFTAGAGQWQDHALEVLTGLASYSGDATGLYLEADHAGQADDAGQFEGTAAFRADFGGSGSTPLLSGTVTDITDLITSATVAPDLTFYNDGTLTGGSLAGTWAHEYSGGVVAPDAVSGVFNARDTRTSLIGAFGAQRD